MERLPINFYDYDYDYDYDLYYRQFPMRKKSIKKNNNVNLSFIETCSVDDKIAKTIKEILKYYFTGECNNVHINFNNTCINELIIDSGISVGRKSICRIKQTTDEVILVLCKIIINELFDAKFNLNNLRFDIVPSEPKIINPNYNLSLKPGNIYKMYINTPKSSLLNNLNCQPNSQYKLSDYFIYLGKFSDLKKQSCIFEDKLFKNNINYFDDSDLICLKLENNNFYPKSLNIICDSLIAKFDNFVNLYKSTKFNSLEWNFDENMLECLLQTLDRTVYIQDYGSINLRSRFIEKNIYEDLKSSFEELCSTEKNIKSYTSTKVEVIQNKIENINEFNIQCINFEKKVRKHFDQKFTDKFYYSEIKTFLEKSEMFKMKVKVMINIFKSKIEDLERIRIKKSMTISNSIAKRTFEAERKKYRDYNRNNQFNKRQYPEISKKSMRKTRGRF